MLAIIFTAALLWWPWSCTHMYAHWINNDSMCIHRLTCINNDSMCIWVKRCWVRQHASITLSYINCQHVRLSATNQPVKCVSGLSFDWFKTKASCKPFNWYHLAKPELPLTTDHVSLTTNCATLTAASLFRSLSLSPSPTSDNSTGVWWWKYGRYMTIWRSQLEQHAVRNAATWPAVMKADLSLS